jgi:hypothetical protein
VELLGGPQRSAASFLALVVLWDRRVRGSPLRIFLRRIRLTTSMQMVVLQEVLLME